MQIISSSVSQVSTESIIPRFLRRMARFGHLKNSDGRLGIGNTSNKSSPTEITGFNGVHRLADVVPNHLVELNPSVDLGNDLGTTVDFYDGQSGERRPDGMRRETEHNVTLTKGFYLGKYEVTQSQYVKLL